MPEFLLHTIWLNGLFRDFPQTTTDGRQLEVIDPGNHNMDAGQDFSAAQIRMDGVVLVGNVEIHVKSSDWMKHGHHQDAAYDTVILHVVKEADKEIFNSRGEKIAQCELKYPEDPHFLDALLANRKWLCAREWEQEDERIDNWKRQLLKDRMMRKCAAIEQLLLLTHNGWNDAFYVTLAHNFGFHTNSLPFEQLAINTPLSYLQKHRNSLFQLTALLMGQANLIREEEKDLQKEYAFLRTKFGLTPMNPTVWKHARMRPQNSPELRIRQFAQLLYQSDNLFSKILDTNDIKDLVQLFEWIDSSVPPLGKSSIEILLINTVIPYKYAYAKHRNETFDAISIMEKIPAENNTIVRQWKVLGQVIKNAADTQALLHLYQNYCQHSECINREVGYQIFKDRQLKLF